MGLDAVGEGIDRELLEELSTFRKLKSLSLGSYKAEATADFGVLKKAQLETLTLKHGTTPFPMEVLKELIENPNLRSLNVTASNHDEIQKLLSKDRPDVTLRLFPTKKPPVPLKIDQLDLIEPAPAKR